MIPRDLWFVIVEGGVGIDSYDKVSDDFDDASSGGGGNKGAVAGNYNGKKAVGVSGQKGTTNRGARVSDYRPELAALLAEAL